MNINSNPSDKKYQSILSLINYNKTNIIELKLLSCNKREEGQWRNTFLTFDVQNKLKENRIHDYKIIDAIINGRGEISNMTIRLGHEMSKLQELNILDYRSELAPKEIEKREITGEFAYIMSYSLNTPRIVSEEEANDLVNNQDQLVIHDGVNYLLIDHTRFIEKYWCEDIFKAIYFLKHQGFYLGTNNPEIEKTVEELMEYQDDEELILFRDSLLELDSDTKQVNLAKIQKVRLPENLETKLKKVFQKKIPRFPKLKRSGIKQFKVTKDPDKQNVPDQISDEVEIGK